MSEQQVIDDLQTEISDLNGQVSELETQIEGLRGEVKDMEADKIAAEQLASEYKDTLEHVSRVIGNAL